MHTHSALTAVGFLRPVPVPGELTPSLLSVSGDASYLITQRDDGGVTVARGTHRVQVPAANVAWWVA